jgi:hypothetical protein
MSNFAAEVRKQIRAEDLPEPLQNLAVVFDIENVRVLIERHPNERIYIPQLKYFRDAIKRALKDELKSKKHLDLRKLSYELGCTADHLRVLIKEVYEERLD